MPMERVPGTELSYYLIAFDAEGRERPDGDGLLSSRALDALTRQPITDVFLLSHGWKGDIPAARQQYEDWIGAMAKCSADIARMKQLRPGFMPLLIGLHWPSLPWGDEDMAGGAASFAPREAPSVEALVEEYAERVADTPAARQALRTIFEAALQDVAPPTLPEHVRAAYAVLDRESNLGSDGEDPGADREPFDAEQSYQAMQDESAAFGIGDFFAGLLAPLNNLSFWKMKDRARKFGENSGHNLVKALQRAKPGVRIHLMGHSFGCIVMSATVAGPAGGAGLVRPVDSLALIQGAFSLWSYCSDIPKRPGGTGYFRPLMANGRVAGPIITTQSEFDTAVGKFYPLGAGVARQVDFAPGELPKYGAVGSYGLRGPGLEIVDLEIANVDHDYGFERGKIYNLQSSRIICEGSGACGAHSDIAKQEVAHAVWQAAGSAL